MTQITPTYIEKIRRLPWTYASNAFNSVFASLTLFGSVFVLFLDKLGLPKGQIGLILSVFPFCGILAMFIAPVITQFGLKRTFLIFWGTRKIVTGFLLFTPLVLSRYGDKSAFVFVVTVVVVFALCRAIAESAMYPWLQEAVPDNLRGRVSAVNMIISSIVTLAAIGLAGYVIGRSDDLGSFMLLIGIGVLFGLMSIWCSFYIPGGAPRKADSSEAKFLRDMIEPFADGNFRLYILGLGIATLCSGVVGFVPLYFAKSIGISSGNVILLSIAGSVAGVISYVWGWTSDRFGGKPVLLFSLIWSVMLPFLLMAIPRHSPWSLPTAVGISFLLGFFGSGVATASAQLLYSHLVPPNKSVSYMAFYYACMGLTGGFGPILVGVLLEYSKGLSGSLLVFTIDSYTPLLLLWAAGAVSSLFLIRSIRIKGDLPVSEFAGMLVKGNPVTAVDSIVRYRFAQDEDSRVLVTERMGSTKSLLPTNELVEALEDPSFNVRYEAVISIARTKKDSQMTEALIRTLKSDEQSIASAAAWALGRIGDRHAISALREAVRCDIPIIRANCARSLAQLRDRESVPLILERFRDEQDTQLKAAFASALAILRAEEVTADILDFLRTLDSEIGRREVSLALARLGGCEQSFARFWRESCSNQENILLRSIDDIKSRLAKHKWFDEDRAEAMARIVDAAGRNELQTAGRLLANILRRLPRTSASRAFSLIADECVSQLEIDAPARMEYVLLALSVLSVSARRRANAVSRHSSV